MNDVMQKAQAALEACHDFIQEQFGGGELVEHVAKGAYAQVCDALSAIRSEGRETARSVGDAHRANIECAHLTWVTNRRLLFAGVPYRILIEKTEAGVSYQLNDGGLGLPVMRGICATVDEASEVTEVIMSLAEALPDAQKTSENAESAVPDGIGAFSYTSGGRGV
jgi:hypothetical protein